MSVNVHILPVPGWPGLVRSVRTGALGVLVAGVLLMPFSAPAWIGSGALAASTAGEPAALTQEPIWADDSGLLAYSYPGISVGDDLDGEAVRALAAQVRRDEADERLSTLERLLATPRPPRDPVALAGRLAGQTFPWTSTHPFVGPLEVGRRDSFYVLDQTDNTYKERPAILRVVSEYAYWYVQEGESVRDDDLATAARTFDQQTVPTVRRVFGTEWQPGIDGDNRVTIFLGSAPGAGAYFSSWDEYPRTAYRFSNEREMIHVNLGATRPGGASFDGTLGHEYQHMVHWRGNAHDETWLDEGFAEMASLLVQPNRPPGTGTFQRQPDTQLTTWSQSGQTGVHYQASYLFAHYLAQRFGEGILGQIVANGGRPPDSITAVLSDAGFGVTFDDVFEDWIVANLLDDASVGDGRYGHDGIDHRVAPTMMLKANGETADQSVRQYGAEYVELQGTGGNADLVFEGQPSVRIVGTDATSGRALWWSNRADGLDSTLTRSFDLSGVSSATLSFNLWYDTERDFDFCYVMVSTDGGTRWQIVRGANASEANPTGNASGPGYSGKSGVQGSQSGNPTWLAETVDLTPFVGGNVLVRFEYVTDQGFNASGVAIDDVAIPEIGYADDAETDDGWSAEGFLRSSNAIPQTWSLQLVEQHRGGQTTVRRLRADGDGKVTDRVAGLGAEIEKATLVVSGLAPRTLEEAPFKVTLRPAQ